MSKAKEPILFALPAGRGKTFRRLCEAPRARTFPLSPEHAAGGEDLLQSAEDILFH
jgi:hypothetical protein